MKYRLLSVMLCNAALLSAATALTATPQTSKIETSQAEPAKETSKAGAAKPVATISENSKIATTKSKQIKADLPKSETVNTETKKEDQRLDETVVTASRIKESVKDLPVSVQVITEEDIKNSSAKDLGGLMSDAGIGHVHQYNMALATRVEIRGMSTDSSSEVANRVLVLVNGNRAGTVNLAKIPVGDIARVEIVKGPGSVIYGSQAMGGVINVITKRGKGDFSGSIGAEGGTRNYWKTALEAGGEKANVDYYATASKSGIGNLSTPGRGEISNTNAESNDLSARVGYTFLKDHRLSVGFQHWETEYGSPGYWWALKTDRGNKQRDAVDFEYANPTVTAKYYYVYNRDITNASPGLAGQYKYVGDTRNQGASLQKVFNIANNRIIVGADWARIQTDARYDYGVGKKVSSPNINSDGFAVFAEDKISLFSNRLILSAGMRYDYIENTALATSGVSTADKLRVFDNVTYRGGAVYKITDDLSVRANIGTGFRSPAPLEQASEYISGTKHMIGNTSLDPEKTISYEGGFDFNKKQLKSSFTFFHTEFTDKISSYYTGANDSSGYQLWSYKNVQGAIIQGIEANVSYDIGTAVGWNTIVEPYANVTYKTRYETSDAAEIKTYKSEKMSYTPQWTGAFGVRAAQENWEGRLIFNYIGDERILSYRTAAAGVPADKAGFMTASIKGSYRPIKSLELSLAINNLFNRQYEYVEGYAMPGTTVIGGAKWLF